MNRWKLLVELKFCLLETRIQDHDYAVLANRICTILKEFREPLHVKTIRFERNKGWIELIS
jgi:hypothetical protein